MARINTTPLLEAEAAAVAKETNLAVESERELLTELANAAKRRSLVKPLTSQIRRILSNRT